MPRATRADRPAARPRDCHRCGYPAPDASPADPCPECGTPLDPRPDAPRTGLSAALALAAALAALPAAIALIPAGLCLWGIASASAAHALNASPRFRVRTAHAHRARLAKRLATAAFVLLGLHVALWLVWPPAAEALHAAIWGQA